MVILSDNIFIFNIHSKDDKPKYWDFLSRAMMDQIAKNSFFVKQDRSNFLQIAKEALILVETITVKCFICELSDDAAIEELILVKAIKFKCFIFHLSDVKK